ncbi:hypothetical protein [Robbsia andropogonis]|nr:hypothetical protein [Robbsia andropogonis]
MTDLSKINGNRLGGALWALHAEATRPNHRTMVLAVIGAMIVEGLIVLGVSHVHVVPPPAPRTMRVTMPPPPPPVVKKLEPAPTPVTPKPPSKTPPARPAPALKPAVIPAARHPAVHAPPPGHRSGLCRADAANRCGGTARATDPCGGTDADAGTARLAWRGRRARSLSVR